MSGLPIASSTAMDTKFSLAISSSPCSCRSVSRLISAAMTGSIFANGARRSVIDLIHPALVPTTLERRVEPRLENREPFVVAHEARPHDKDVGVVVLSGQLGD